ncbi:hypothetical protein D3C80_1992470 [compost metagenome]
MQPIHRAGKLRFCCFACLELIPKSAEFQRLIFWQNAEYPGGCLHFTLFLVERTCIVIDKGVACIDLNDVMDDQHLEHTQQINILICMFL